MRPQPFQEHLLDPAAGCVGTRLFRPCFQSSPVGRTLATYLPSGLHDLCGKPIPAPLKCHSAGRGTSVPTGNTEACRWTDCASRREPATVVFSRATRRLSLGAFADRAKIGEAMFAHIQRRTVTPMQQAFRRGDRDAGIGTAALRNSTESPSEPLRWHRPVRS